MTLLPATPHHAPALALIHASAFAPAECWSADAMALQLAVPGAYGFLLPLPPGEGQGEGVCHAGLPAAFILARTAADEAEILTLAVLPAARRKGLAHTLLQAALDAAQHRGAASMFLEVSSQNVLALALYTRSGFTPVGCRTRYYPGGGDALVLRCPISPGAAAAGASRRPLP